jgi:hypothetical protein
MRDFKYNILEGLDEEEEEAQLEFDPDSIKAFEDEKAADISFNDPISLFIKDPGELTALGIHPAEYQKVEEIRLKEAIKEKAHMFPIDPIVIPDILVNPPLGTQLQNNYESLMACIDMSDVDEQIRQQIEI